VKETVLWYSDQGSYMLYTVYNAEKDGMEADNSGRTEESTKLP